ncbi:hypothetical protein GHT06_012335 [Daphnia sinensis]|uniref:SEFIR domain-containing protein n=1 Tax=Daphnia sinensis TaxID=1820382 RepID=A0AAD5LP24_9CRUS|nr:hypothetical protein GHT06_012335 [Daphnia sinensis]
MRADFCFTLLLLALIRQASTTPQESGVGQELDKRKLSTQPSVDYDPNSRTALLNINLDRTSLTLGRGRSVNNFNVEVLRWLTNSTECPPIETCRRTAEVATVVQSRRICWVDVTTAIQCDETIPAGQRRASVLLDHIYTGCYCFRLAFYHDDSIRTACQLLERPLYLHTDVVEYDVFKWNLSLDLSTTGQHELNLFIKLHDDADEFRFYHVHLFRHDDINDDLMECHETDDPINNQYLSVSFPDHHIVQWQVVPFHNLSDGYYCVVVIPEDDRCHPPLIDPEKTCARHSNIVQLRGKKSMVLTYYAVMDVWPQWIAGVAVLFICVIIGVLLKRKMNPILFVDDFQNVDNLLKENVTQSTEIPILLLYSSRSMDRLGHYVAHLKEAIRNYVPNGRVLDDADDEDLANVEGVEWFSNHLQVAGPNTIRVVIFLCSEMMRCQEWFLRSKSEADDDVDQVCCYRLNQLFHHIDENNVYRQVFAIRFDDDLVVGNRSSSSFCLLTPYRSYRWPHDELALLMELGRPDYSNR